MIRAGALLAALLPCTGVLAQTSTARVSGTVTDPTGAVLANVTIIAHNLATGQDRTASTGDTGTFTLPSLQPAAYTLSAASAGFATQQLKDLTLQVGQEFTWSPALTVSAGSAIVEVNATDINVLDTSSARIGANVSTKDIAELPINGRQISQLYLLTPGATNAGTGTFDNIHFSGRSVEENIIRIDGIEASSIIDTSPGNLNGELTSTFRLQQSLEAIQEFRVDSSSYPAEMGTGTGGQISFVSKSGTNKLHGSAFEYLRNDALDARNDYIAAPKPTKFRLNQFGGSIGGPLFHDRLFFFGSYEGLRQVYVTPYASSTLSNYARQQTLTMSPALAGVLQAFPTEGGNAATEAVSNTLSVPVSVVGQNRIQEDFGNIRFDYKFNDRFTMYARYNRDQGTSTQVQDASLSRFGQVAVPQNGAIALNQVLTPRLFNETKFGFNGIKERVLGVSGPSPAADLSRTRIAISGLTNVGALISLSSSFNGVGAPYTGQSYSYIDNLSYIAGRHNLKFGVEVRPLGLYNDQIGGTTYTYNSIANFQKNVPDAIAFYGNLSDKSPFTGLSGNAHVHQAYYIGYAQDEWKATPDLTISYGLRYEYYSPLHESRNKDVIFDINAGTIRPGYAGDWYHTGPNDFGPRVGITYSPAALNHKTVLRLGGGLFFGPGQTEDQIQPEANDRVTKTFSNTGGVATSGKVYPIDPLNDVYNTYDINSSTLGYQPRAYTNNYGIPERVGTYSVSVEQELPGKYQFLAAYVGSQGRNLFLRSVTNLITGVTTNGATGAATVTRQFGNRFAEIDYKTSGGTDSYNAFQSTLQRRYNDGFSFGAQYTFAKELGNSSGSNEATTAGNNYDFSTEFGRGTFDIRHYLNATALYDLPFGHGKHFGLSGIKDVLFGGFQVGGILNARSGVPIDVLISRPDVVYVGNAGTAYAGQVYSSPVVTGGAVQTTAVVNVPGGGNTRNIRRPNIVPGVNPFLKQYVGFSSTNTGFQYLNPAAFSVPAPGTNGNSRRNNYSGPGLVQFDLTASKAFPLGDRFKAEFKADAYNILNHPNPANPGTVRLTQGIPSAPGAAGTVQPGTPLTTAAAGTSFGTFGSTVGNQVGLGTNRQLQLSLRLSF